MWNRKKRPLSAVRSRAGFKNICSFIDRAKVTGQTPKSWQSLWEQLPPPVMKATSAALHEIPSYLVDLQAACSYQDARKVRQVLNEVSRVVCQPHRTQAKRAFFSCGGVDSLLTILFIDDPWLRQSPWVGQIWNTSLKLIKELSQAIGPRVPLYIFEREKALLTRLFAMLRYKTTFESASNVTEDVLSTTSTLVDVGMEVPDFAALMGRLSVKHRALFCRVLALFVYSPHSSTNTQCHSLARNHGRGVDMDSVIERNQSLLIDDPHLLGKVVNLLKYQINVIDSLQYGNFLALLISINDESAPSSNAPPSSNPTSDPSTAADAPGPGPFSSLFTSSLDTQAGMPNLSDILLAGGFPVGGVYEMSPTSLPPPYPEGLEESHPGGSLADVPPIDVTSTWPAGNAASRVAATMGSSEPSSAAFQAVGSMSPSQQHSSPSSPRFPDPQTALAIQSSSSSDSYTADGTGSPWAASTTLDWMESSSASVTNNTEQQLPEGESGPWVNPNAARSPSPVVVPYVPESHLQAVPTPHLTIHPPILSTLITSLLSQPSGGAPSLQQASPAAPPHPHTQQADAAESASMVIDPPSFDAESASGWLAAMTTPLLSDTDAHVDVVDDGGWARSASPLLGDARASYPSEPTDPNPHVASSSSHSQPTTTRDAPATEMSHQFPSSHHRLGSVGVGSHNALARNSLLEYTDGPAPAEEDEGSGANRRLSLQSLTVVSCQVEVLFVLSALLSGKRKVEVREKLTQLKLLNILNDIFDFIFWEKKRDTQQFSQSLVSAIASALGTVAPDAGAFDNPSAPSGSVPSAVGSNQSPSPTPPEPHPIPNQQHPFNANHPADCDCRPEAARRIQFLRLVHKYCDCADYHHLHKANPETRESKRRLARKLVGCLLRHRSDTNCRYWLASCLEAVLRGNHWDHRQEDQVKIADNDLVPHLLNDVVHCLDGGHTTTRLQSSFDLLAELVKFNRALFADLNALLRSDPVLYRKLGQVVCSQLVHSNVFLRSVVLSLHYFQPTSLLHACQSCTFQPPQWGPSGGIENIQGRIQAAKEAVRATMGPNGPWGLSDGPLAVSTTPWIGVLPQRAALHATEPPVIAEIKEPPTPWANGFTHTGHGVYTRTAPEDDDKVDTPCDHGHSLLPEPFYDFGACLITRFIQEHKVLLIRNLMVEIRLDQINKENICCINTALVFFFFSQEAGCLEQLLLDIRRYEMEQCREFGASYGPTLPLHRTAGSDDNDDWFDCLGRRDPFRNFHKLMRYWVIYYDGRSHDTETIFHSSRIPWDKWWSTVVTLLELLPRFYLSLEAYTVPMDED